MSNLSDEERYEYRNAVLLIPSEIIQYWDPSSTGTGGEALLFPVYHDDTTNKTLLKCDICGKFIVVGKARSIARLHNHRNQTGCKRKAIQNAANSRKGFSMRERGGSHTVLNHYLPKFMYRFFGGSSIFAAGLARSSRSKCSLVVVLCCWITPF